MVLMVTRTVSKRLFLFFLFPIFLFSTELGYFRPPEKWHCADPSALSPAVEIAFFTKASSGFYPSINLSKEETNDSLKQYLKIVKSIHIVEPETTWRDLGDFSCQAGKGRLTEITQKNRWGEIRQLQFIYIHKGTAYVLTGASTKKEFAQYRKEIVKAIKSFKIIEDLFAEIPSAKKRSQLQANIVNMENFVKTHSKKESEKAWKKLQNTIVSDLSNLGPHFQYLFIKEMHQNRIYPLLETKE